MSISDRIVVMKEGVVQQIGRPQAVYDDPADLFVAQFLGTPPIDVFAGAVRGGQVYIGDEAVLPAPGLADQPVSVGIRPEGFVPAEHGALTCALRGVEVMGRDISVVFGHAAAVSDSLRAIVAAESAVDHSAKTVKFDLKPHKVFLFAESGARLRREGE